LLRCPASGKIVRQQWELSVYTTRGYLWRNESIPRSASGLPVEVVEMDRMHFCRVLETCDHGCQREASRRARNMLMGAGHTLDTSTWPTWAAKQMRIVERPTLSSIVNQAGSQRQRSHRAGQRFLLGAISQSSCGDRAIVLRRRTCDDNRKDADAGRGRPCLDRVSLWSRGGPHLLGRHR